MGYGIWDIGESFNKVIMTTKEELSEYVRVVWMLVIIIVLVFLE